MSHLLTGLHVAGQQIGDVRLFGSVESGQGAVEILTSIGWTGICPVGWTNTYARIICQSLGYDFGVAGSIKSVRIITPPILQIVMCHSYCVEW